MRQTLIHICHWVKVALHYPIALLYVLTDPASRAKIDRDLQRWTDVQGRTEKGKFVLLAALFLSQPAFRNLFYHRIEHGNTFGWLFLPLAQIFYQPLRSLHLRCPSIGGGLYIQHGFATIVRAVSIGENCRIAQQSTIGANHGECPTIGNNVSVYCGAIVIGGIELEDNCAVAAGAVVTRNCEDGWLYAGVPAKKIRQLWSP